MCACNTGSKVSKQPFSCFRADLEQYKCTRCDSFRTHFLHFLKRHLKLNHTEGNEEFQLYRCENCDFETWSKYLIVRHRMFSNCYNIGQTGFSVEKFQCGHCLYTTESKESLKSHEFQCFKFQCEYCLYSTPYKGTLQNHIKFEHSDFLMNQFECRLFPLFHKSESITSILQTEHDHCYYKKNRQLNNCDIEPPNIPEHMLITCFNLTHLGKFECKLCLHKIQSEEYLRSHLLTHLNNKQKQFQCEHCPFKTIYKYNFKQHENLIHSNLSLTSWFKCSKCPFKTQYRHYLDKHQYMHLNPWFYCTDCSFRTKWKEGLIKHQKNKHYSVTPSEFQCKYCPFKTRHSRYLVKHQQYLHTNPALMKWFRCHHCFYITNRESSLKLHQQTQHNRSFIETLRCKYCSFETYYKYSLKKHLLYKHSTRT